MKIHEGWNLTLPLPARFCLYVPYILFSIKLGLVPFLRCPIFPDCSYRLGLTFKMLFLEDKTKPMSHLHYYESRHLKTCIFELKVELNLKWIVFFIQICLFRPSERSALLSFPFSDSSSCTLNRENFLLQSNALSFSLPLTSGAFLSWL